jgi:predicted XRE-type DNA-binding protein
MKQISKKGKGMMDTRKKKALESKGYKVGSAEDFLGLSKEESEYIELKLALSQALADKRKQSNLTQAQLAKMLKSSQSRVAKMEKGDPTISMDLLIKSLLAMGADKKSIAKAIV